MIFQRQKESFSEIMRVDWNNNSFASCAVSNGADHDDDNPHCTKSHK